MLNLLLNLNPEIHLKLACVLDSKDQLLNDCLLKIRSGYELTGEFKQDKELLYSLHNIYKFTKIAENEEKYSFYQPLFHYMNNLIALNTRFNVFLGVMTFISPKIWLDSRVIRHSFTDYGLKLNYLDPQLKDYLVFTSDEIVQTSFSPSYTDSYVERINHIYIESRVNQGPKHIYYLNMTQSDYTFNLSVADGGYDCQMVYGVFYYNEKTDIKEFLGGGYLGTEVDTDVYNNHCFSKFIEDFYDNSIVKVV